MRGQRLLGLGGADEADRDAEDRGRARRAGVDHLEQVEQRGRARCRSRRPRRRAGRATAPARRRCGWCPAARRASGTRGSRSVQTTSLPAGSRARVTPEATIAASQRIGAPARSAARGPPRRRRGSRRGRRRGRPARRRGSSAPRPRATSAGSPRGRPRRGWWRTTGGRSRRRRGRSRSCEHRQRVRDPTTTRSSSTAAHGHAVPMRDHRHRLAGPLAAASLARGPVLARERRAGAPRRAARRPGADVHTRLRSVRARRTRSDPTHPDRPRRPSPGPLSARAASADSRSTSVTVRSVDSRTSLSRREHRRAPRRRAARAARATVKRPAAVALVDPAGGERAMRLHAGGAPVGDPADARGDRLGSARKARRPATPAPSPRRARDARGAAATASVAAAAAGAVEVNGARPGRAAGGRGEVHHLDRRGRPNIKSGRARRAPRRRCGRGPAPLPSSTANRKRPAAPPRPVRAQAPIELLDDASVAAERRGCRPAQRARDDVARPVVGLATGNSPAGRSNPASAAPASPGRPRTCRLPREVRSTSPLPRRAAAGQRAPTAPRSPARREPGHAPATRPAPRAARGRPGSGRPRSAAHTAPWASTRSRRAPRHGAIGWPLITRCASGPNTSPIVSHSTTCIPSEASRKRHSVVAGKSLGISWMPGSASPAATTTAQVRQPRRRGSPRAPRSAGQPRADAQRGDRGQHRADDHRQVQLRALADRVRVAHRRRVGRVLEEGHEVDDDERRRPRAIARSPRVARATRP